MKILNNPEKLVVVFNEYTGWGIFSVIRNCKSHIGINMATEAEAVDLAEAIATRLHIKCEVLKAKVA